MAKGDICSIQDCLIITRYGDVCDNHIWRFKKYGSYDLPDRTIVKICKAPDCDRPVDKAQHSRLCVMHRVRWSRHKSYDLPVKTFSPGIVHVCKVHGELKPENAYTNDNYSSYQCLACKQIAMKKFDEQNPNRDTNALKNFYYVGKGKGMIKVTKEQYKELHEKQNGLCDICGRPERMPNAKKNGIKRLAIDHCHTTNKVRGLLCQKCNQSLGGFEDSIKTITSAIAYLKKHGHQS